MALSATDFQFQRPLPRAPSVKKLTTVAPANDAASTPATATTITSTATPPVANMATNVAVPIAAVASKHTTTQQRITLFLKLMWHNTTMPIEITVDPNQVVRDSLTILWPHEKHLSNCMHIMRSTDWLHHKQTMSEWINLLNKSNTPLEKQDQALLYVDLSQTWKWNGFTTDLSNVKTWIWNRLTLRKRASIPQTDDLLKLELSQDSQRQIDSFVAQQTVQVDKMRFEIDQLEAKIRAMTADLAIKNADLVIKKNHAMKMPAQIVALRSKLVKEIRETNYGLVERCFDDTIARQAERRIEKEKEKERMRQHQELERQQHELTRARANATVLAAAAAQKRLEEEQKKAVAATEAAAEKQRLEMEQKIAAERRLFE
jgi:hypothetical protein